MSVRLATTTEGHSQIIVSEGGDTHYINVNRLAYVAEHGLDALDPDERVEHKNGIKWVNNPENLITPSDKLPSIFVDDKGNENIGDYSGDGNAVVSHARLLYVAEHGFEALPNDVAVTHKNGVPWDNRPGNLRLEGFEPPSLRIDTEGAEYFECNRNQRMERVRHNRLLYVAEHGFDALEPDERVMHKNGVLWDNRPENLISERAIGPKINHDPSGYECFYCAVGDGIDKVLHHRLLYVAEHGFDALEPGEHVHHQSHIPWDNRPDMLEVSDPDEHGEYHGLQMWADLPVEPTSIQDLRNVRDYLKTEYTPGETISLPEIAGAMKAAPVTVERLLALLADRTELVNETDNGFRVA